MSSPYTSVSISGYNSSPPEDDGSTLESNQVEWSKHIDKIGDPIKTAVEAIDTNVQAAFTAMQGQTPEEAAAGATPVHTEYDPGQPERYEENTTPGTTDMSLGLQAAISQNLQGGPPVTLLPTEYAFGTTLEVGSGSSIIGVDRSRTELTYTGAAQGFVNSTPGSRIFDVVMRNFRLDDEGTGTIGIDLERVSNSTFENLVVNGFTTGIEIDSPTSGHSVYNRFYNVTAQNCTTGFLLTGTSSNAHKFISCRSNVCTVGARIEDSNGNSFISCQFESGGTGVVLTASGAGLTLRNVFIDNRFETNSTEDWNVGTNCAETTFIMNHYVDNNVTYTDNGTRTQLVETQGDAALWSLVSALLSTNGTPWTFERTVSGGSNVPALIIRDSNTSAGTPTTLQVEIGRSGGHALRVTDQAGSNEVFGVLGNGRIRTNQDNANTNTPSGATAHELPIYNEAGTLLGYIPIYGSQW